MVTINQLDDTARRILANMNEAGEEYISALVNSIFRCRGIDEEVTTVVTSLSQLRKKGLVNLSVLREPTSLEWIKLSDSASIETLRRASEQITWTENESCWKWTSESPIVAVLLTNEGETVSNGVLSKFGWEITNPRDSVVDN